MAFSKAIFGKNINELTYTDIEEYFQTEKEESLNLEFKSYVNRGNYREKENVIKKSVCALLNSEGGIIVWGAPIETRDADGSTKASGELTPFNIGLDKDRLINILSSTIVPMPIGIMVNFLENDNGDFVVIVDVEKSIERPHQFSNCYYVRLDGQTRVAPHYLIKALITSQDFPIIRGHVRLKHINIQEDNILIRFRKLIFNTSQFNNEKNAYSRLMIDNGTILINEKPVGNLYEKDHTILSYGRPLMSEFYIRLTPNQARNDITLILQFGGEKSPSKTSIYKYNIWGRNKEGHVADETIYIQEKNENILPSDVPKNTDDDKIERILDF